MLKNNHNKKLGLAGEDFAVEFLKKNGLTIIDRNWHYSKNSEIDIIAIDSSTLVFVEVKARSNLSCGHPFEAVNYSKLKKIELAIPAYIEMKQLKYKSFRIDIIALIGKEDFKVEYLKGVSF